MTTAPATATVRRSLSATSAADVHHRAVGLWAWTRQLDPGLAHYAALIAGGDAFSLRATAPIADRDAHIDALIDEAGVAVSPARQLLARDISALAFLYARTARTDRVLVRLEAGRGQRCPLLHVDHVAMRLLCTYSGPGTEWMDPDSRRVRRLQAGWASLLKGRLYPTANGSAIAHRSPPARAGARLVLIVDDATQRSGE